MGGAGYSKDRREAIYAMMAESFYIVWDVGGWNCDRNPNSRDAIVILDNALAIVGRPWRGNLRSRINEAEATASWLAALFDLCCAVPPTGASHVTLGIDTPLGFSDEFLRLASTLEAVKSLEESGTNPYLYLSLIHISEPTRPY